METNNKTAVIDLISALKSIPAEELNVSQKSFLQLFLSKTKDYSKLKTLINNENLFKGSNISGIESVDLNDEDWQALYSSMASSTSKGTTKPQIAAAPTAPLNIIYFTAELNEALDDINIRFKKPKQAWPSELSLFIANLDKVQNTVNQIYKGKVRESLMGSLAGIARVGGTSTFLELAILQLEQYKNELLLRKGDELKNSFLKTLGKYSFVTIVGAMLIMLAIQKIKWLSFSESSMIDPVLLNNGLFIIIGASVGAWLSFAIRKKEIIFMDLRILSDNKTGPLIRLIIVLLISLCFYFMFITNFVNIKIGGVFDTSNLSKGGNRNLAFVVGIFLGLSENTIGGKLTSQVDRFISKF